MSSARRRTGHPTGCLRQVIAERGKDHVLDGIGSTADASPGIPDDIRVLRAELEAALFAVVRLVPKADGGLHQVAGVAVAMGQASGSNPVGPPGHDLGFATRIAE